MFKLLFGYFLIIHVLGDFYFQSDKLSHQKQKKYGFVVYHSLIYLLIACVCIIPYWSIPLFISAALLSAAHFLVDSVKYFTRKEPNATVFVVDQLIHIGCIAIAALILVNKSYDFRLIPAINGILSSVAQQPDMIFKWTGLVLLSYKPANIAIKQMVAKYRPAQTNSDQTNRAGAFIGTLERFIILLLLSVNQYSAIGLVLTAKSVARYNQIAENRKFAEYYLLGTLLSTLYAICIYFILI